MSLYQRILIPTDGSPSSNAVLEHAARLAHDQDAKVKLITVVDETLGDHVGGELAWIEPELLRENLLAGARKSLEGVVARAKEGGLDAESELIESTDGRIDRAILNAAASWEADLLVITTHGRHGLARLLLGSTAETLVRKGSLPILVVPIPEQ